MNNAVILFVLWNILTFLLGTLIGFAMLIAVVGVPLTVLTADLGFLVSTVLASGFAGWLFLGGAKSLDTVN